ncbi:nucleoside/nucleotide kinase family protein [Rhodococcus chondri]|uniref:Uridine kinase n=1 Tax=Rhodococcus chondri TaxID=3065941 RepID=A0ABU7JQ80_9NOCA|nr:uridine kinase [Rhodococcus sp. CC-R104]MEE2031975.1 uridine kinase [Rhodococcus sp. CC-R104]
MARFTPISPVELAEAIAERAAALEPRVCVAISAADAAAPTALADDVAARLRVAGRAADVVSLHDFVRPASLRLEHGHTDPASYRWDWFDYGALDREVVRALHDRHRWLPRLWDEDCDRSARAQRIEAPAGQVLVVAGPMLLGRGLSFDLTVQLRMSRAALERRTSDVHRWTIAPLLEHDASADADIVVKYDHPDRPAVRSASEQGS